MEVILKKAVFFLAILCLSGTFYSGIVSGKTDPAKNRIALPKEAVSKKILDNGLVVLAKTSSGSDLVAIDVKVMAGPSVEREYEASGISHLVEHMLFKGTDTRKPGDIEKEIKSYGGVVNGSVSQDLTDYHVILPSGYLKQALIILKDMLSNAAFDRTEFEKEKEVILNEIRMNLDNPDIQLMRLLNETAYMRHPYRYPPIGYETAFRRLTREDALKYYNLMYAPNNITVSIVGGVTAPEAIDTSAGVFADLGQPRYCLIGTNSVEPQQIAIRTAEKESETNLAYLAIAFHSTSLMHKDLFAMDILAIILGKGDNSRLNKALLKTKRLVHSIACWNYTPRDPGLFVITAILDKEKLEEAKEAIIEEIAKLKDGKIDDDELEKAKRVVIADYIFSRENIEVEADNLTTDYMLAGTYEFGARYVDGVQKVTKEDVKKAASTYLIDENSNIAMLLPKGYRISSSETAAPKPQEYEVKKEVLANGLRILVRKNDKTPTVSITAVISGGISAETASDNGISNLTARLLAKGTVTRKEEDIAGVIEGLGGKYSAFSGFDAFGINIDVLKPDVETALVLLKDILTAPIFPQDELEKEKSIVLAMIKRDDDDIFDRGFNRTRKGLFADSPYGFRILGEAESVKSVKRDDVVNFYRRCFTPESAVISVSGDVDVDKVFERLKNLFAEIRNSTYRPKSGIKVPEINRIKPIILNMDRKESLVVFGFQTVNAEDADRYALEVLGSILSGSSGRLFSVMRDRLSLAYVLGCIQKSVKNTGFAVFYAATSKEKVAQVVKVLREEIYRVRKEPVGDEELAMAKRELRTSREIAMQANLFFSQNTAIDELYGLGCENLYRYKAEVDKVTGEDVRMAANKYLDPDRCAQVIITQK